MNRVALIGVTGYGAVHFDHLRRLAEAGRCDFAAAAVVNPDSPEAAAPLTWLRAHGAAVHGTAETLFAAEAGRLDLVCLPVGIAAHEPLVKAALAAGANVLVEKPAAGCTAAVDRMIAAERAAAPRRVFVGFQHVCAPEVATLRGILSSGALGAVRRVAVSGVWPRSDDYYARNGWAGRLAAPDGTPVRDSPANNAFAHYLNLALMFAAPSAPDGAADPVAARGALWRARPEIETFDTCMVRFDTAEGVPILLCLSHAAATAENPRIRVDCARGTVRWTHDGPWEAVQGVRGAQSYVVASGVAKPPHAEMFHAVLAATESHAEFAEGAESVAPCSLALARHQVRAVERLSESIPVWPLSRSAVRLPGGQWSVPGLSEAFAKAFDAGDLVLPEWS